VLLLLLLLIYLSGEAQVTCGGSTVNVVV